MIFVMICHSLEECLRGLRRGKGQEPRSSRKRYKVTHVASFLHSGKGMGQGKLEHLRILYHINLQLFILITI